MNLLLGFLSYLVPKNNNQIILGSQSGTFFDNSKYFYLYLLNRKDNNQFKKIYWITKSEKVFHQLNQRKMPVIRLYSFEGFIAILRSKFIITTHTGNDISYFLRLPGRFNKIQAQHGAPLKGYSLESKKKNLKSFVLYLSNKEKFSYKTIISATNEIKKSEVYYKNFTVIGCPRNDILINNNYLFENYKKELFLNNYSKVILYAPTWREKTPSKIPFSELFLKKFNEYLVKQNSIFLLKGHYMGRSNIDIRKFSNIQDVSEIIEDIVALLIHIDIFITDYSGLVMDFLLLEKPIIFYPYDFNEYSKLRNAMDVDYFNDLPGPFVKTEEEFFECIKSVEENFKKSEYQKKFVDFKNKYHKFQDGNSSQRLYEYLIKNS